MNGSAAGAERAGNGLSNDVSVIDTTSLSVATTLAAGDDPWGVAVTADPRTSR